MNLCACEANDILVGEFLRNNSSFLMPFCWKGTKVESTRSQLSSVVSISKIGSVPSL